MLNHLLPLRYSLKSYLWGDNANSPIITKFIENQEFLKSEESVIKSSPIAEFWFGNHKNGESSVFYNNSWVKLSKFWEIIKYDAPLNFLSKILCIKKPLSIQLHPAKLEAIELNKNNPRLFPDANPKPEMAIALTNLKLLCGMRSIDEINTLLTSHPAFLNPLGTKLKNSLEQGGIRSLLSNTLLQDMKLVKNFAEGLLDSNLSSPHDKLAKMLIKDSSELDPGIIALFFFNYFEIDQGKAIFIQPKVPHAYIEGYAFESMQNSDNVVRGGLTSKEIDITNFCSMVNTNYVNPQINGQIISQHIQRHTNNELPFILEVIKSEAFTSQAIKIDPITSHEILVVLNGTGKIKLNNNEYKLIAGSSFYSPGRDQIEIVGSDLLIFRVWSEASF